ncbi:DNA excision repair protein ERCC-1 [Planoprotostelium fungivorum]|uniref:DNA excision repair protein ERCC-1 n=1 Tax=Planoprotostelium fungivorum TaxID=1890364 RepID=A0A2P6NI96_9EUKA|nr:DNA excision repair protein ERCC-1 [Planoprotostelium fungivorum]
MSGNKKPSPYFKKDQSSGGLGHQNQLTPNQIGKIHVNKSQKGNRLLDLLQNVEYMFENVAADYVFGGQSCALFLSCKYHLLYGHYISNRMRQIKSFRNKILLVLVDVEHNSHIIRELSQLTMHHDFTMILAWSLPEAARYLETFKLYDGRGSEMLRHKPKEEYTEQVTESITTVRGVNRTDARVLLENFETMRGVMNASSEELSICPGVGEKKVKRLFSTFTQPFIPTKKRQQQKITSFTQDESNSQATEEKVTEEDLFGEEEDIYKELSEEQ